MQLNTVYKLYTEKTILVLCYSKLNKIILHFSFVNGQECQGFIAIFYML